MEIKDVIRKRIKTLLWFVPILLGFGLYSYVDGYDGSPEVLASIGIVLIYLISDLIFKRRDRKKNVKQ